MYYDSIASRLRSIAAIFLLTPLATGWTGCSGKSGSAPQVLRLATATSTRDSGLLNVLIPPFEQLAGVRVQVIATGTGKAIELGKTGEVDVLFVHAQAAEEKFMADRHGVRREDVMVNTFELLGPPHDPGAVRGLSASAGLQRIAASGARFVSRGDTSGTHERELKLWNAAGGRTDWEEYRESGQAMGATLMIADELSAYTLCDRATYLRFRDQIELEPLAVPSEELRNPYGVIVVNSSKHPSVRADIADEFVEYLISQRGQRIIAEFEVDGEKMFAPLRFP
ncbi:MAG: substrate-binding domain-containing protein [Planctomycetota bacterium]